MRIFRPKTSPSKPTDSTSKIRSTRTVLALTLLSGALMSCPDSKKEPVERSVKSEKELEKMFQMDTDGDGVPDFCDKRKGATKYACPPEKPIRKPGDEWVEVNKNGTVMNMRMAEDGTIYVDNRTEREKEIARRHKELVEQGLVSP